MKNVKIYIEDSGYDHNEMALYASGEIFAEDVVLDFVCTRSALTQRLEMSYKGVFIVYDLLFGADVASQKDSEFYDSMSSEDRKRAKKFVKKMFIAVNDKMQKVFHNTFEGNMQFLAYLMDVSNGELDFGYDYIGGDKEENDIDECNNIHGSIFIGNFGNVNYEYKDGKLLDLTFPNIKYCPDIRNTRTEPACAEYISSEIEMLLESDEV